MKPQNHILYFWSQRATRGTFLFLLSLNGILMVALRMLDGGLNPGILPFEFAGNSERASEIIAGWATEGQVIAGISLGLDYLFLFTYSITISLACLRIGDSLKGGLRPLTSLGTWLAWGALLAGLSDAVENFGLIQLLMGASGEIWAPLAWGCAMLKFILLAAAIIYMIFGGILSWRQR